MKKQLMVVLAACSLLVLGVAQLADGARRGPTVVQVTRHKAGPEVAPFDFSRATVRCPRGYIVTGGSASPGATETTFEAPSSNGKAWVVSAFNPGPTGNYGVHASAVCVKGARGLRVKAARGLSRQEAEEAVLRRYGR